MLGFLWWIVLSALYCLRVWWMYVPWNQDPRFLRGQFFPCQNVTNDHFLRTVNKKITESFWNLGGISFCHFGARRHGPLRHPRDVSMERRPCFRGPKVIVPSPSPTGGTVPSPACSHVQVGSNSQENRKKDGWNPLKWWFTVNDIEVEPIGIGSWMRSSHGNGKSPIHSPVSRAGISFFTPPQAPPGPPWPLPQTTPHRRHEAPQLRTLVAAVGLGGGSENKALSEPQVAETSAEAIGFFRMLGEALRRSLGEWFFSIFGLKILRSVFCDGVLLGKPWGGR